MLREHHIAFLFAQRHHPAMRAVGPIRRELGVRTIFNVLGPLTNPAGANRQVIGVARPEHVALVAEALRALGAEAGAVVHARDGLDEIAGEAPTDVVQFDRDGVRRWTLDPAEYGVHASRAEIRGGDAAVNAAALRRDSRRRAQPARRSGCCSTPRSRSSSRARRSTLDDGMARARTAVETGRARAALDALRERRRATR